MLTLLFSEFGGSHVGMFFKNPDEMPLTSETYFMCYGIKLHAIIIFQ